MIEAATRVADLQADGFDGIQVICPGCRRLVCYPFRLLIERRLARPASRVAVLAARLRCKSCGRFASEAPAGVQPWRVTDGQPGFSPFRKPES